VPVSAVVNLSQVFGTEDATARFVKRYLKATHCDLFFADGAVLVEGPAERILVPKHFVRKREKYKQLQRAYITWLEIGGSHAHRLRSLIEHIGISTLVITDLDSKTAAGKSAPPARNIGLLSRNETLKSWIPELEKLDDLLDANPTKLAVFDADGSGVRTAYQQPVSILFKSKEPAEAIANTFEDALLYENIARFEALTTGTGLLQRFRASLDQAKDLVDLATRVGDDLSTGGKAEFAMDLLYLEKIDEFVLPGYIDQGLLWLCRSAQAKGGRA